jgi:hypothetical protein
VPDDARGHDAVFRRQVGLPVPAEHQHPGLEGLALVDPEALHEQLLALPDAVLLPSD